MRSCAARLGGPRASWRPSPREGRRRTGSKPPSCLLTPSGPGGRGPSSARSTIWPCAPSTPSAAGSSPTIRWRRGSTPISPSTPTAGSWRRWCARPSRTPCATAMAIPAIPTCWPWPSVASARRRSSRPWAPSSRGGSPPPSFLKIRSAPRRWPTSAAAFTRRAGRSTA